MKKFYLIPLMLISFVTAFAQPLIPAPTPIIASSNVLSLYSNAFTNVPIDTWKTVWSPATVTLSDLQIAGNDTKLYDNLSFVGVEFTGANVIDATNMQYYHIDLWTPNATTFKVKLVDFGANGVYDGGGDDRVSEIVVSPLTQSGWNSYNIPLTDFVTAGLSTRAHLAQMLFEAVPFGSTTAYIDNVYFYNVPNAPSLSNFSIPTQVMGAAPFAITAPTSNSTGAFTYSSSNTNVATIAGNTITIIGIGTSVITATQAAAGAYSTGIITTTLTVTPAAAPTPTVAAANVISMFSNAYTNRPIDTWRTSWTPPAVTLSDLQIAGNDTKLYTNLSYVGVEFTGANVIDATNMQYYHIDVWTPNATTFRIKLVDYGANGVYDGGDDKEHEYTVSTLIQGGWNSYNIPLSAFTNLTTRAHLAQMIFSAAPAGSTTVYIDNVFFYNVPNAPSLSNFSIPTQATGAVPFTITAPTSNSSGAFTYTSSNTSVATISGNIITVVGGGTAIITANQAAAGVYGTGSITAQLVVTFGPPMIAAPLPVALPINVLSLYSDTYTNLAGINWNPNWNQSTTVTDIVIAGNTTRKYDNLNYQGVEFASPFDVSSFTKLHIDVWTPNCTAFKVFLINIAPAPFVEQSVTLTPTLSGWNSYNIDLATSFRSPASVVDLTKIGQMKFESVPFGGTTVYVDNMYFFRANPVPVKLINFAAKAVKNVTNLTWTTLNEQNNKGFSVEKSTDGANFNAIGFVNGVGNASNNNNYATFDKTPATGYNYYRLKQIDLDGNFTYSAIVKVKFDKSDLLGFSFFPNPVKDVLKITIGAIDTENAMVSLVNEIGQVIVSQKVNKSAVATELKIKVANIASGNYYLRLVDGVTNSIQKVVVNN